MKLGDPPGMFIVAGDQLIIGGTGLEYYRPDPSNARPEVVTAPDFPAELRPTAPHGAIAKKEASIGVRVTTRDSLSSAEKNGGSIVMLTIGADNMGENPWEKFNILHYNGGDVLWDVEGGLADWIVGVHSTGYRAGLFLKAKAFKNSQYALCNAPSFVVPCCGIMLTSHTAMDREGPLLSNFSIGYIHITLSCRFPRGRVTHIHVSEPYRGYLHL